MDEKLPEKRDMELEPFCPLCEFFYPETEECDIICCDDPFKGPDEEEEKEYQKDIIGFLLKKHKKFYNKKRREPKSIFMIIDDGFKKTELPKKRNKEEIKQFRKKEQEFKQKYKISPKKKKEPKEGSQND